MDKFIESLKKGLSVVTSETKKITKSVAGKTNNLVDITKLNIALKDTDKKITEIYEKIGKAVYQNYSEGIPVTDSFSDLCEEIDEFVAEKEELVSKIEKLKNVISCPNCGLINGKDSEICAKCGAELYSETETDNVSEDKVIEVVTFEDDEE